MNASRCRTPLLLLLTLLALLPATAQGHAQSGLGSLDEPMDRSTPRATVKAFLDAGTKGDWDRAAHALYLNGVLAPARQKEEGPEWAKQLKRVLDRQLWIDAQAVPDDPEAGADAQYTVEVGKVPLGSLQVPIELRRVAIGDEQAWLFSRQTVSEIPELYDEHGPSWIQEQLPPSLTHHRWLDLALWQWLGMLVGLLLAIGIAFALTWLLLRVSGRLASKTKTTWDDRLIGILRGPSRLFLTLFFYWALLQVLDLPLALQRGVNKGAQMTLTVAAAWLLTRLLAFITEVAEEKAVARAETLHDELRTRGLQTQMRMIRRVGGIVIGILAISVMLLQFDAVKSVGMSLLASAGVAGIVLGIAAQRSLGGLLAGIQLSITQPLRIGDTVILEGEWGTIEEINLTYVVMKIWDERRLIVPVPKLLDQTFENWTRISPELLGTVYVYADYRLPIQAVRDELDRILDGHDKFDGRAKNVLVTGASDKTMEVRAMVSAANAGDLWGLRCDVRERLISWLQQYEDGEYLPRSRVELERDPGGGTPRDEVKDGSGRASREATRGGDQQSAPAQPG